MMLKIQAELGSFYRLKHKPGEGRFEIRLYEGKFLQFNLDPKSKTRMIVEILNGGRKGKDRIKQVSAVNIEDIGSYLSVDVLCLIAKIEGYLKKTWP
jgi:hypothetical protein